MNFYKMLIIVLCISNISNTGYAMNYQASQLATLFSGVTVGGIASSFFSEELKAKDDDAHANVDGSTLQAITIIASSTILTWWLAHKFFSRRTPRGILHTALSHIKKLDENVVAISQERNISARLRVINRHYATRELTLLSAFNDIIKLQTDVQLIENLLQKAQQSSSAEKAVKDECKKYLARYNASYFSNIQKALIEIKSDQNFLKQFETHELINNARATQANMASWIHMHALAL